MNQDETLENSSPSSSALPNSTSDINPSAPIINNGNKSFFAFEKSPIDIDRVKLIPTQHVLQSQVYEAISMMNDKNDLNNNNNNKEILSSSLMLKNFPLLECIPRVPMTTSSHQMVYVPNMRSILVWGGAKVEIRPLDYNLLSGRYVNDENSEKEIGLNHWIDSDGLKIDVSEVNDNVLSSYLDTSFSCLDLKSEKWETRIHCSFKEFESSIQMESVSHDVEQTLKIFTFSLQNRQWTCYNFKDTLNPNIPSPHLKGQVATYRPQTNTIHVYGGQYIDDYELISNDCIYVYNCTTSKWENRLVPDLPILGRSFSTCAYCKKADSMFVFGGVLNVIGELTNELCQYSFSENQWTVYKYASSKPIKPVYGHCMCLIDDRYMFIYGGCEQALTPIPSSQCIVFDILAQRWYDLSEVLQLFNSVENPAQMPPLNSSSIIFDENSRRIIIYGGNEIENGNKTSNTRFLFLLKDGNNNLENMIGKPKLSDVLVETL
ncbi:predicted protein [Naegleria gruberi]|uniref:Predicted protein n=1 Tax=Naegleria gruberi TaxID=5762 RepID=D2VJL7_NAEGR|nr:uncharacterized protein NAEGRDRAFT_69084 [Naegleria gruberi]EFC42972.1 predicted protein [Naegleria gruberi]|eukprot:XP_002675716.1 predicted protein [Naegleria gruberi strain NEG-M]